VTENETLRYAGLLANNGQNKVTLPKVISEQAASLPLRYPTCPAPTADDCKYSATVTLHPHRRAVWRYTLQWTGMCLPKCPQPVEKFGNLIQLVPRPPPFRVYSTHQSARRLAQPFCRTYNRDQETDRQINKLYGHDASRSRGCNLDITAQIIKSRRESMRMLMESIVPKY